MKLNLSILDESITIKGPTIFTVADATLFGKIVRQLYDLDDHSDLKIFSENQKKLSTKDILVIIDIMLYDSNSTSIQKALISDLEDQFNLDLNRKEKVEQGLGEIFSILEDEVLNHELDLEISPVQIGQLIKLFHPKISTDATSILEKTFGILKVYSYLQSKLSLLVFVNLATYFSSEDLSQVIEFSALNNLNVLFIEHHSVEGHSQYFLDQDFFLFNQYGWK